MVNRRKTRVLVVDDSMFFREALVKGLTSDPGIEVVATAVDPFMARDKIIEYEPDVMVLDVELPRMNGIEFLKRLMPQYPIPVVVISANAGHVFEALKAGAVDFVAKPDNKDGRNLDGVFNELIIKVKIASTAKVGHWKSNEGSMSARRTITSNLKSRIIAIGASTGGTEATSRLLKMLPREMPGILIVQHMPPNFTRMYAERLNNSCLLEVKEAQNGDVLCPGRVLIAPGDLHMRLKMSGQTYKVECFSGETVNGHCPSVDVLFDSVAEKAGKNAIGVILTGMGADGAKGLLKMRKAGARTIGQDQESCVVYGMPMVAYNIGAVEYQAPLDGIPQLLCDLV